MIINFIWYWGLRRHLIPNTYRWQTRALTYVIIITCKIYRSYIYEKWSTTTQHEVWFCHPSSRAKCGWWRTRRLVRRHRSSRSSTKSFLHPSRSVDDDHLMMHIINNQSFGLISRNFTIIIRNDWFAFYWYLFIKS